MVIFHSYVSLPEGNTQKPAPPKTSQGWLWTSSGRCGSRFKMINWSFPRPRSVCYPLVNVYITMERSTIFHGKTHYKWQFSIAMLNYRMVSGCCAKQMSTIVNWHGDLYLTNHSVFSPWISRFAANHGYRRCMDMLICLKSYAESIRIFIWIRCIPPKKMASEGPQWIQPTLPF